MSAVVLIDDLESYVGQYGTHGAIQRLQFIASKTESKPLKIEAYKLCLEGLKRTQNAAAYSKVHGALAALLEGSDRGVPPLDTVWVEATQKQSTVLKDLYEQDLQSAKSQQLKDAIRNSHTQLISHCIDQGDYPTALRYVAKSREFATEPQLVFNTCMAFIRLSALQQQYSDMQSIASKAQHTQGKEDAGLSKAHAAYGLYFMNAGKFQEAATSFAQVRPQDLSGNFFDVLCAHDVALYGTLCALGSLDRKSVQAKILESTTFRECLDLLPQVRELALDFCSSKYAQCLSALETLKPALLLDVHLHDKVDELFTEIRRKGMVQYFAPFMSVSLHTMAGAFNTDVDGIQAEVAQLIGKGQLEARIDSHKKILHARHTNQRMGAYQNAMRVSEEFLTTTQALILRMNVLKNDFGVHAQRSKK